MSSHSRYEESMFKDRPVFQEPDGGEIAFLLRYCRNIGLNILDLEERLKSFDNRLKYIESELKFGQQYKPYPFPYSFPAGGFSRFRLNFSQFRQNPVIWFTERTDIPRRWFGVDTDGT